MVHRQVLDFLKAEIMMKELRFGTAQGHFFLKKSLLERTRMQVIGIFPYTRTYTVL